MNLLGVTHPVHDEDEWTKVKSAAELISNDAVTSHPQYIIQILLYKYLKF